MPIRSLQLLEKQKIIEVNNNELKVLNWDGFFAPVVYQYDRHRDLAFFYNEIKAEELILFPAPVEDIPVLSRSVKS